MHHLTTLNNAEVLVEFTVFGGRPGRYWGPPEHCHPDEPPEVEISEVLYQQVDVAPLLDEDTLDTLTDQCLEYVKKRKRDDDVY
jgi:hypothetical protein